MVFYQTLDEIFDLLYAKLGRTNELIECKEKLIYAYENEDKYNSETLLKKLVPTNFKIDENGCVITC
jgi:hypothetical protein